jgi:hypothetical protein
MSPLRIAGLVMISFAVLFGAVDLYYDVTNLGSQITVLKIWTMLSTKSMNWVQMVVENYIWAPIWTNGIAQILLLPAWLFFSITGVLAFLMGRKSID